MLFVYVFRNPSVFFLGLEDRAHGDPSPFGARSTGLGGVLLPVQGLLSGRRLRVSRIENHAFPFVLCVVDV